MASSLDPAPHAAASPPHAAAPRSHAAALPPHAAALRSPAAPRPQRLALGRSPRRLSYERRIKLWLAAMALPALLLAPALTWQLTQSRPAAGAAAVLVGLAWLLAVSILFEQLMRPLQTLANVVAALREDDFSFRARGARRGDSLGDLALEINALAATLQQQRTSALDALTLVERVLGVMQAPVLAFDGDGRLRLWNEAARAAFAEPLTAQSGQSAAELGIEELLATPDQGIYRDRPPGLARGPVRWAVRRTTFRLQGVPHTLLVLADVDAALREEERLAWQRIVRVLSHEINNSLTPIQSIAGSLRSRLPTMTPEGPGQARNDLPRTDQERTEDQAHLLADFHRGLGVVEERAASLHRFLAAYQRLARLPAPVLGPVALAALAGRVARLELRLPVQVEAGPDVTLALDVDQMEQALINLVQNAADAALQAHSSGGAQVCVRWFATDGELTLRIEDNGPGIDNPANLFVPFYTTKARGSGIGLVLAQQVVVAHGGSVTLESRAAGPGSVATVVLPRP